MATVSDVITTVRETVEDTGATRLGDVQILEVLNDGVLRLYAIRPDLRFGGYDTPPAVLGFNDAFPFRPSYLRRLVHYTVAVLEAEQDDSARVDRAQLFMAQFDLEAFSK